MAITTVAVIGAGAMGQGIAQVCAQQGYTVLLHDAAREAAATARQHISDALDKRVAKNRMTAWAASDTLSRVTLTESLTELAVADLVVEAIVEDFDIKRGLFQALETHCRADTLLCSNTSSLSISELAATLHAPHRFAGLHFFNPPTAMKLVEVVNGPETSEHSRKTLLGFARLLDKTPVSVFDSPGFIVNRCARPFYGEALHLLEHEVASAATLDACLKSAGGFPLGPFELIDLVGLDINLKASEAIWRAFGCPARFQPSPLVATKVAAGELGRKRGVGFYRYTDSGLEPADISTTPACVATPEALLSRLAVDIHAYMQVSDGRTAAELAGEHGHAVVVFDVVLRPWPNDRHATLAFASCGCDAAAREQLVAKAAQFGVRLVEIADRPGLIALRVAAMLINEARFALAEEIASPADMDTAMRLGLNFALGPWEMLERLGHASVRRILEKAAEEDVSGRYAPAP